MWGLRQDLLCTPLKFLPGAWTRLSKAWQPMLKKNFACSRRLRPRQPRGACWRWVGHFGNGHCDNRCFTCSCLPARKDQGIAVRERWTFSMKRWRHWWLPCLHCLRTHLQLDLRPQSPWQSGGKSTDSSVWNSRGWGCPWTPGRMRTKPHYPP